MANALSKGGLGGPRNASPRFEPLSILTRLPTTRPNRLTELLPWSIDPTTFHELIIEDARISLASIPIN